MTIESVSSPSAQSASLSIIVPTYQEAESLPLLLDRLQELRTGQSMDLEVLIMDDNSRDGTSELIATRGLPWVKLVVRTSDRGLSPAVVDGLKLASKDNIVVMDADLSHPPEAIPTLLASLDQGNEFVIGSRYVPGASTDENWGFFRWLNSKVATLMARPLTRVADPMSGFFAFRRSLLANAQALNPIGYKIGLELLVKCNVRRAAEVPIHFAQRAKGESKLTLQQQLKYIQHLRRLFLFRYPNWSHFLQFIVVGGLGTGVNLLALMILLKATVPLKAAVAAAIAVSMIFNFVLNRRFSFSYARPGSILKQFAGFVVACSVGALINYGVTIALARAQWIPYLAALVGILAGTFTNFILCRLIVFRHPPPGPSAAPGAPSSSSDRIP
jgi:dolichol-phosphate mannosyltransferase